MVEYRQLGSSGLKISVPIIGAMSFGDKTWAPWVVEEEEAFAVLKEAWDRGVNTIDTANSYSGGVSESIIAKFIKKYNIPRHEIIIATKCFFPAGKDMSVNVWDAKTRLLPEYMNNSGLSRTAIFNQVEASLERLQTPYIDLLQIHRYDPNTPAEETMKALHDLVQSGKVRYIGASSMWGWQFAHLNEVAARNGWTKFVSMQSEYSLLYREDERELIPYCKYNGIGLIPWAPMSRGDLARPHQSEKTTRLGSRTANLKFSEADITIINRVEEIAKKHDKPMSQISLAWVQTKVSSPIVGTSSAKRVEENIVSGFELTEEEIKYLEEPYVPKPVRF